MEWFTFILGVLLWFLALYLIRERYTLPRLTFFSGVCLVFGLLLSGGVDFPSGSTSIIAGDTTTNTIVYTTYLAQLSGANSSPVLWGLSWVLIVMGVLALLSVFLELYRSVFARREAPDRFI